MDTHMGAWLLSMNSVDWTSSSSREIRDFQEEMDFQEHLEMMEVLDSRENLVEEEMGQREIEEYQDYQVR